MRRRFDDHCGGPLAQHWAIVTLIEGPARFRTTTTRREHLQLHQGFVQQRKQLVHPTGNHHWGAPSMQEREGSHNGKLSSYTRLVESQHRSLEPQRDTGRASHSIHHRTGEQQWAQP
jgi:hypothetical protein